MNRRNIRLTMTIVIASFVASGGCFQTVTPPPPTPMDGNNGVDSMDGDLMDADDTMEGDGIGDDGMSDMDNMDATDPDDVIIEAPSNPLGGEPGSASPGLTETEATEFQLGKSVFDIVYTAEDGLGPSQTGASCVQCHGQPTSGGSGGLQFARFVGAGGGGIDAVVVRNSTSLFGLGAFELVTDTEILSRQDLNDDDGDGISGRANIEVDRIGRFGRKAQAATLESMIRGMLANQMGIISDPLSGAKAALNSTASPVPFQVIPPDFGDMDDGDTGPEIIEADLRSLITFVANLATPLRGAIDESAARGEATFESIGCGGCHVATLLTTIDVEIHPYSDLLIHDMGAGLADGIVRGVSTGSEFRTQPLWGLSAGGPYLHDGRASTLEVAILAHGGEAEASRDAFDGLTESDQADLLSFLNSL